MTTATFPNETPPTPPDALSTLMAVSQAAHNNEAAAVTFYRRALVIVGIMAVLFALGLIWAGNTLSGINSRGACNAIANHVIAKDVHLLVAGQTSPQDAPKYSIPPLCH